MTLPEFQQLSPAQQLDTLWDKGYMMSERKDGKFVHVLYCIFDFWVELKYTGKSLKAADATILELVIQQHCPAHEDIKLSTF